MLNAINSIFSNFVSVLSGGNGLPYGIDCRCVMNKLCFSNFLDCNPDCKQMLNCITTLNK